MASHTSAQKGVSVQTPNPYAVKSQELMYNIGAPIMRGDLTSPTAMMLRTISKEAAMKEAERQKTQMATSSGISPTSPAATRMFRAGTEMAVKGAAGAAQDVWKMIAEGMANMMNIPPTTSSRQAGGGGWGVCCFIFCAADPDDKLLQMVRRYKDSHYSKLSPVAQGYKRLAIWIVPLMRKSPLVKNIVKVLMVNPMSLYAKAFYEEDLLLGVLLYPITRVWVSIYWMIGKLYGEQTWKRYYRLLEKW